jgi:hypothetical protein
MPAVDAAYGLRFSAVVRFSFASTVGLGGGVLPVEHRAPSPFTSSTIDVGYGYTLTRGPLKRGGGVIITFGVSRLAF